MKPLTVANFVTKVVVSSAPCPGSEVGMRYRTVKIEHLRALGPVGTLDNNRDLQGGWYSHVAELARGRGYACNVSFSTLLANRDTEETHRCSHLQWGGRLQVPSLDPLI